jgi:hypothetical protein
MSKGGGLNMKTSMILSAVLLTFGSNFAHSESTVTTSSSGTVRPTQACPMIAKICSDGSVAKYTGKGCETTCPSVKPPEACPKIAKICSDGSVAKYTGKGCETSCPTEKPITACSLRVCSDGSPAKAVEGKVCEQRCPEDKILACPQIARMCKDGSAAKYLNRGRSCATFCTEDFSPKLKIKNLREKRENLKSKEAR